MGRLDLIIRGIRRIAIETKDRLTKRKVVVQSRKKERENNSCSTSWKA